MNKIVHAAAVLAFSGSISVALAQAPGALPVQRVSEGDGSTLFGNYCATCHGKMETAPAPAMLRKMAPERIYQALTTGAMANQAKSMNLADKQLRDIAEWTGGKKLGTTEGADAKDMPNHCSGVLSIKDVTSGWNGWSNDLVNSRYAKNAGLSSASVRRLQLKWAFGLPAAASVYGQPTIVDGKVFVSSDTGIVYALDAQSGCVHWSFKAQSGVPSAVTLGPTSPTNPKLSAYFGDIRGNVYSVDVVTGEQNWKKLVDDHPLARVRAAVKIHNGRVYVPVASLEEPESSSPNHPCCTFRGSIVALEAATGKQIWKTYTITETPGPQKTRAGVAFLGPSGAGVWGPVQIDTKRNAVYVSTGNTFSAPDVGRGDAIMALDMNTGRILWTVQDEAGDVWHTGCPQGPPPPGFPPRSAGRGRPATPVAGRGPQPPKPADYYCPDEKQNPDWDFSAGVMQYNLANGKSLLIAGQKSGMVWAHDPDNKGAVVWKSDISRGQIVFGGAADETTAYFGMRGGGIAAVNLADGLEKWYTAVPPQASMSTHAGISAAVTLIPGVVFTAGLDGMVHAFSTADGRPIWEYDTTQPVKTVNGVVGQGGSIGSAGVTVANGMLFVPSGYTGFQGGHPGNLLLAFGPPVD